MVLIPSMCSSIPGEILELARTARHGNVSDINLTTGLFEAWLSGGALLVDVFATERGFAVEPRDDPATVHEGYLQNHMSSEQLCFPLQGQTKSRGQGVDLQLGIRRFEEASSPESIFRPKCKPESPELGSKLQLVSDPF